MARTQQSAIKSTGGRSDRKPPPGMTSRTRPARRDSDDYQMRSPANSPPSSPVAPTPPRTMKTRRGPLKPEDKEGEVRL
jgi:hypothetical protein